MFSLDWTYFLFNIKPYLISKLGKFMKCYADPNLFKDSYDCQELSLSNEPAQINTLI